MRRRRIARCRRHCGSSTLVDNGGTQGAPVVVETNPTYYNLLGRMEYRSELGSMVTDFSMIKAGALHRANGGYLVLHATDVLTSPGAWDVLKRSLKTGLIRIENLGERFTPILAATLRVQPEPIPLDVKVVLIGPPNVYYLLQFQDEDFSRTAITPGVNAHGRIWSRRGCRH
jgi:predicted ATP-dependent protease